MTKLDDLVPDSPSEVGDELFLALNAAGRDTARLALVKVCELLIANDLIHEPLAIDALQYLKEGTPTPAPILARLELLVDEYDRVYFDLVAQEEAGRATAGAWVIPFTQARALSAVSFALAGTADGIRDCVHEAIAATDDADTIRIAIEGAVNGRKN